MITKNYSTVHQAVTEKNSITSNWKSENSPIQDTDQQQRLPNDKDEDLIFQEGDQ